MNPATNKTYSFDLNLYQDQILAILKEISESSDFTHDKLLKILSDYPRDGNKVFSKNHLVQGYKALKTIDHPELPEDPDLLKKIQMKPVRTVSGVTPVTILTKPFPCPGKCIFCPNDIRMPKSYLSDEPGAQRAERNSFDPYLQTFDRLRALQNIGHDTNKVEIIILGGTWSYYPESYQIWFIKRCFEAMNDFGEGVESEFWQLNSKLAKPDHRLQEKFKEIVRNTKRDQGPTYNQRVLEIQKQHGTLKNPEEYATWEELFVEHKRNEFGKCRCVGLVIETRPDNISEEEVIRIRKLGCTKTQIGFQSLNDHVLELNHRGHDVEATKRAVELLRWSGFKIHAHWMANLYGSNVEGDIQDYQKLFTDEHFRPDELKVYPCSLIETAELMDYYKAGKWQPYSFDELFSVIRYVLTHTPEYCRLTRVIRDIPGTDIVVGNKITNFRQLAEERLKKEGIRSNDIRGREIKTLTISRDDLTLKYLPYSSSIGTEIFMQFVTKNNDIAGFLRLSLPDAKLEDVYNYLQKNISPEHTTTFIHPFIPELSNSAVIREIHVYGKAANIGEKSSSKAQHLGLGTELIERAKEISSSFGYKNMAVISAVGTREYYRKKGFTDGELYQLMKL